MPRKEKTSEYMLGMSEAVMTLLKGACAINGGDLNDFIVAAALERAKKILAVHERIALSEKRLVNVKK